MLGVGRYRSMNKFKATVLVLATITVLSTLFTSCNSTSELLSKNPAMANTSNDNEDLPAKISELENRIEQLERGLDPRVIEFNMVKSAIWEMIVDNELWFDEWGSDYPYTNDMNEFPCPDMPLYGFDKDGDGEPDTNYIPFEKTDWFYQVTSAYPDFLFQGIDLDLVESWQSVIDQREIEAYETEWHNVQTAVLAAMADAGVSTVSGAGAEVFGNTSHAASPPFTGTDCVVSGNYSVGDYIVNGANDIACSYSIAADGTVNQVWTP